MIDDKTKSKLLEDLERTGIVGLACAKAGVHRSNYHRWQKEDPEFRKRAREAERLGRANLCDAAEHGLFVNVKKGSMDAIKYALSHNSPFYKAKGTNRIVIEHRAVTKEPKPAEPTLEEEFDS